MISSTPGPRWLARLWAPRDVASLAVFRILFGLTMFVSLVRFVVLGWVDKIFVQPTFFFKYPGFEWVQVWDAPFLYLHFSIVAIAALCVALGLFYRAAIVTFFIGFTYIQLMEVTTYLNHYYLVVLLAGILCFLPAHGAFSIDARRRPELRRATVPAWMIWLLRFQIATVYMYAGLAKLGSDWLLHAQPLNIWMSARTETPVIGPLLDEVWLAYLMAWAGFLYDLTIPLWLSWRRSRPFAYAVVIVFHFFTWVFFDIGMFPFIMTLSTPIFFSPDWPRRAMSTLRRRFARLPDLSMAPAKAEPAPSLTGGRRFGTFVLGLYVLFQVLFPARHWLYDSDVLWSEEGMRYAWKVMVREKNGSITYRVRSKSNGRQWHVNPLDYLSFRQYSDMTGQPDLIVQLGKHIAWDFERRGLGEVEVQVDALVSLNGRRPSYLIDPAVDINRVDNGWRPAEWILPSPKEDPIQLRPVLAKVH